MCNSAAPTSHNENRPVYYIWTHIQDRKGNIASSYAHFTSRKLSTERFNLLEKNEQVLIWHLF